MAAEGGGKEMNEIKTQFTTREGVYKLLTHSEYSRPNRVPFNSQGSNPVKVSFVNVNDQSGNGDRICFNVGRELYFYIYKGVRKAADLSKPIDKRIYKGTQPTCHDFNPITATAESVSLLVGFSAGQVQLIDPIKKETSKLFNEETSHELRVYDGFLVQRACFWWLTPVAACICTMWKTRVAPRHLTTSS
ncbi:WD repeat-containing protein 20 isoform X3 [Perca fluviatilis]|uniref:WD repeat-containing protein 20 isoform X3 n=1 Tax=Perca fluviatilis TaxID=8168 RepID=UPI0019652D9B|nr:WD repeat-containing protein 20 isoform X3 [Perca fluviatilis]